MAITGDAGEVILVDVVDGATNTRSTTIVGARQLNKIGAVDSCCFWVSGFFGPSSDTGLQAWKIDFASAQPTEKIQLSNELFALGFNPLHNELWTISSYDIQCIDLATKQIVAYPLPNALSGDSVPGGVVVEGGVWLQSSSKIYFFNRSAAGWREIDANHLSGSSIVGGWDDHVVGYNNGNLEVFRIDFTDGLAVRVGVPAASFRPSLVRRLGSSVWAISASQYAASTRFLEVSPGSERWTLNEVVIHDLAEMKER